MYPAPCQPFISIVSFNKSNSAFKILCLACGVFQSSSSPWELSITTSILQMMLDLKVRMLRILRSRSKTEIVAKPAKNDREIRGKTETLKQMLHLAKSIHYPLTDLLHTDPQRKQTLTLGFISSVQFSSVQSLSRVQLFATP